MPLSDETDLICRLRTGDDNAYEQLVNTHSSQMHAVARRFFGDTDDAADAVQNAFVSAFQAMGSFAATSRLATWLHRITVNACLMKLRQRKRSRLVSLDDALLPAAELDHDAVSRAETSQQVRTAIERLPASYREVIRLRDLVGLDTEETASRLGTTKAVVKIRLHRARQALRTLLAPRVSQF
jgi:RNA polymerase sigma-70 factor (ECF subfamily)